MPLRKGLADIAVRTHVAADVSHRFMEHMATLSPDFSRAFQARNNSGLQGFASTSVN